MKSPDGVVVHVQLCPSFDSLSVRCCPPQRLVNTEFIPSASHRPTCLTLYLPFNV